MELSLRAVSKNLLTYAICEVNGLGFAIFDRNKISQGSDSGFFL